jgi:hypothetical protein
MALCFLFQKKVYICKTKLKFMNMKELINTLQEIDNDFYKGIYTAGERYDLIEGIYQLLKNKQFIR